MSEAEGAREGIPTGATGSRATKTTRVQYQIYLQELQSNKNFRDNKFCASQFDIIKETWDKLTSKLNAAGGPVKDVNGWKRVFTDWKSQVRNKARKINAARYETGNVGTPLKQLTDLEELLLSITGKVVVTGMQLPEMGVAENMPAMIQPLKETENTSLGATSSIEQENLPPCTSIQPTPPKRKKSLMSYLETISTPQTSNNDTTKILEKIADNLSEFVKIERKKLKLEILKLEVQYPGYIFQMESDEDD